MLLSLKSFSYSRSFGLLLSKEWNNVYFSLLYKQCLCNMTKAKIRDKKMLIIPPMYWLLCRRFDIFHCIKHAHILFKSFMSLLLFIVFLNWLRTFFRNYPLRWYKSGSSPGNKSHKVFQKGRFNIENWLH